MTHPTLYATDRTDRHTFEHITFRLEVRDRYNSPRETESLRQFLAGEEVDFTWADDWTSMVREATAQGRRFERVRVVSLPLTDYCRYGVWTSQFTVAAGEDIRYLTRDQAKGLPEHDYWLFDSKMLVRMHFGEDDRFLGGEIVEHPAVIVQHNHWRDVAWHHASRRDDFATQQNVQRD